MRVPLLVLSVQSQIGAWGWVQVQCLGGMTPQAGGCSQGVALSSNPSSTCMLGGVAQPLDYFMGSLWSWRSSAGRGHGHMCKVHLSPSTRDPLCTLVQRKDYTTGIPTAKAVQIVTPGRGWNTFPSVAIPIGGCNELWLMGCGQGGKGCISQA